MINLFGSFFSHRHLGLDLGTSSIRIVELKRTNKGIFLDNFVIGSFSNIELFSEGKNIPDSQMVKNLKKIKEALKPKTKKVTASLPDFLTFFASFTLPPMTKEEVDHAVRFEAKQYSPLPLEEATLDWQIIEEKKVDGNKSIFKILLVVVPNEVIARYQGWIEKAGLELDSLEAEVFSLSRALIGVRDLDPILLVDIGGRSSTCSVFDGGKLRISYRLDTSGNDLTASLARSLEIKFEEAEKLKIRYGLLGQGLAQERIRSVFLPLLDMIVRELKQAIFNYKIEEKKEIRKIILSGKTVLMPGLLDYFKKELKGIQVEFADPFKKVILSQNIEKELRAVAPEFAVAVGAGLRVFS